MTFIYVVRPVRATFPADATEAERELIGRHFQHIKSAHESGKVTYVGRCEDAAFGLVVFEAPDLTDARTFAHNDPAVAEGLFSVEVREFRVVLK